MSSFKSAKKINKIKIQDFSEKNVIITELKDQKDSKQSNAYINYINLYEQLEVQTPWVELLTGGIPRLDDYHPNDKSRCVIKVPFNNLTTDDTMFYDKMKEFDNKLASEEVKQKLFGKKAAKYKYSPSIYTPPTDDEDSSKPKNKTPTMKVRISINLEKDTQEVSQINTLIFNTYVDENGVKKRDKLEVATIDDVSNIVRFKSTIRLLLQPIKLWAGKSPAAGADKITYGVIWQTNGVEVERANSTTNASSNADFLDSDEEDVVIKKTTTNASTNLLNQLTKKTTNYSDDESDEEVATIQTPVKKLVVVEESEESDEESEEEIAEVIPEPPKKPAKKVEVEKVDKKKKK